MPLELDGLDLLPVALVLRLFDHLHEVCLNDLARYRRERGLHVVERVRVVAHDLLRQALHHLLEERARALQDRAGELVDGVLLRRDALVAFKPGEVERLRVFHRGGEARALVGLAERREVGRNHLAEEPDLSRRVGVRGRVEYLVEALGVELRLDLFGRHVGVGVVDEAAMDVFVPRIDLEHGVDEVLQLFAALGRHREDDVVELRELRPEQLGGIADELRELRREIVLGGGDGEALAVVGLLELGVEYVHHLAETVLHDVRDLRRARLVDETGVLDDLGEGDDVLLVRKHAAHRFAGLVDHCVADHRAVGENEVRDEVLDGGESPDVVQRLGRRRLDGLGHGVDDLVDVARDRRLDDELAFRVDALRERDVRHLPEHLFHLGGEVRVVAHELRVESVEFRLRIADVLAVERALGELHEYAGIIVLAHEVYGVFHVLLEYEAGELAREALFLGRHEADFEIAVVHHPEDVLRGRGAQRLRIGHYATQKSLGERVRIHVDGDFRREGALADHGRNIAVIVLDELHRLASELEFGRFADARGQQLERLRHEALERVDHGRMEFHPLVHGIPGLAARVAARFEIGQRARRRKKAYCVRQSEFRGGSSEFVVGVQRFAVHKVAGPGATGAHIRGIGGRPQVVTRDGCARLLRKPEAAVGVFVENRPYLRARQRGEPGLYYPEALIAVFRDFQLRRKTEPVADFLHRLGADAPLLERIQKRLLDLQNALGRKLDIVLARLPDVVVDLDELGRAVVVRLDVDLPGVVVAGRDAIELCETDVECQDVFSRWGSAFFLSPSVPSTHKRRKGYIFFSLHAKILWSTGESPDGRTASTA